MEKVYIELLGINLEVRKSICRYRLDFISFTERKKLKQNSVGS
jgi:hypothetical protein